MKTSHDAARRAIDRAFTHWTAGEVDAAMACCREASRLDPGNVDALAHTGTLLWWRGDRLAARRFYLDAIERSPAHVGVLVNLATLDNEAGDLEASMRWIERAEAACPHEPQVLWRKGLLELAMGDYERGWRHHEAGLFDASLRGPGPGFGTPVWDGAPCDRLLLWHEQGFGDTIQFVRYARLCRARAKRIVVLCPPELTRLLRSCPDVDVAVDSIGADDFDAHVPMMSLPMRFGTTLETIPADVPYLHADPARFAERFVGQHDRLKVGLVWAGNVRRDQTRFHVLDDSRSLPLAALRPLLAVGGVAFNSLQMGPARDELAGVADTPIVDAMEGVADFADTAAIVEHLDLVISVDTAVAHVAGAMGKPVWVLSRLDGCWRWLRNRPDSPWYPTARVFGQTARDDWSAVIERATSELRFMAAR